MFVLEHNPGTVDRLAFAPVGPFLAAGYDERWFGVWNLSERRAVSGWWCRFTGVRPDFRFAPASSRVCYAREPNEVYQHDPATEEVEILCEGTGCAENLLLTRDGSRLLTCNRWSCEFQLHDLTRGHDKPPVWTTPVYSRNVVGVRVSIELLPGEERFVVVENHKNTRTRIAVRSLGTGELLVAKRNPNKTVSGFALSPDGASAVVASEASLFLYRTEWLKAAPRKVPNDNRKHFTGIAFHPSGRYLAATSNDATVKLYDTTTWEVARTFTWDIGRMRSIAFSPDGTLAAAGSDTGKVVVWDVDV